MTRHRVHDSSTGRRREGWNMALRNHKCGAHRKNQAWIPFQDVNLMVQRNNDCFPIRMNIADGTNYDYTLGKYLSGLDPAKLLGSEPLVPFGSLRSNGEVYVVKG